MTLLTETMSKPVAGATRVRDYCELTKPRLAAVVMVTVAVGFLMASPEVVNWSLFAEAMAAITLLAASSGMFNQYLESDRDARMERTRHRPLPAGRLSHAEVLAAGAVCMAVGGAWLWLRVNPLTSILGLLTIFIYIALYTPLKQKTSLNTLVGAVCGALPPVLGWTAASNEIGRGAILLFLLQFIWQNPHFLSLAWYLRDDYASGGFRMLSVEDDDGRMTTRQITLFSLVMLPVSLLPTMWGVTGVNYFYFAAALGVVFLAGCLWLEVVKSRALARKVFYASVAYLPVLMAAMVLDKVI